MIHSCIRSADRRVDALVGQSPWAAGVRGQVLKLAGHESDVLISGPTGTGKELIARAVHGESRRADKPFVPVDCAALSGEFFVSQLFGHIQGAFTGARHAALGAFRAAHKGTIFLDEIGELEPNLQARLLRTLQERTVVPLGTHEGVQVDVRVIAATNRSLLGEVRHGRFRADLYYRLNVVCLRTEPLRQHPEDIELLAYHFLNRLSIEHGLPHKTLAQDAVELLVAHDWPGNVRELCNQLERAVIFSSGNRLTRDSLSELVDLLDSRQPGLHSRPRVSHDGEGRVPDHAGWASQESAEGSDAEIAGHAASPAKVAEPRGPDDLRGDEPQAWLPLAEIERRHILRTLEHTQFNQSAAARLLQVDRQVLRRKIRKLGVEEPVSRQTRPPTSP
jgi:DNA-binding NtrC family response regulator